MTQVHDVLFPVSLSIGARGGPQRETQVVQLASGREFRNARHTASRRRWDLSGRVLALEDLASLTGFFEARMGQLYGFRFRDPTDMSSASLNQTPGPLDQPIGEGDGALASFQLVKACPGSDASVRRISRPVAGSVRVAVDGVEATQGWVVLPGGVVAFDIAPEPGAAITAGFEFDVPARFDADRLDSQFHAPDAVRLGALAIVELME